MRPCQHSQKFTGTSPELGPGRVGRWGPSLGQRIQGTVGEKPPLADNAEPEPSPGALHASTSRMISAPTLDVMSLASSGGAISMMSTQPTRASDAAMRSACSRCQVERPAANAVLIPGANVWTSRRATGRSRRTQPRTRTRGSRSGRRSGRTACGLRAPRAATVRSWSSILRGSRDERRTG